MLAQRFVDHALGGTHGYGWRASRHSAPGDPAHTLGCDPLHWAALVHIRPPRDAPQLWQQAPRLPAVPAGGARVTTLLGAGRAPTGRRAARSSAGCLPSGWHRWSTCALADYSGWRTTSRSSPTLTMWS